MLFRSAALCEITDTPLRMLSQQAHRTLLGPGTQRLGGNSPEAGSKPIPQLHPHWAQRSGCGSRVLDKVLGTTLATVDGSQPQPFSLSFGKKVGVKLTFPSQAPRGSRHAHRGQACSQKPPPPSLLWVAVRRTPVGRGQRKLRGGSQAYMYSLTGLPPPQGGHQPPGQRKPRPVGRMVRPQSVATLLCSSHPWAGVQEGLYLR